MLHSKTFLSALLVTLGLGWGLATVSAQDEEPPTPLEAAMGTLQGGMKKLRPLLEDPAANQEVMVATLHEMQTAALTAVANPPAPPEGFPEGGEFTWRISFQRQILQVADSLFECENGVYRGNAAEVAAAYQKANELKKSGHDSFEMSSTGRLKRARLSQLAAFVLLAVVGAPSLGQDEVEEDALVGEAIESNLALEALRVLQARCVACHAPDAEDRKAVRKWPDALDVEAMIPDIIEPDFPAQSYMLELIDEGEMPPEDSGQEPVTEAERATLLAWIERGAPRWPADAVAGVPQGTDVEDPIPPGPGTTAPAGTTSPAGDAAATSEHVFEWKDLGVLHPLLVHFPIALLLATVLAELLVACGARGVRTASRFCAWLGFLGGLVAGATGWLQAEVTTDRHGLVETHRWLGIASVVAAFFLALSLEGRTRGGGSRSLHVALVLATAVLVSLTAHWGGEMVWGTDHFSRFTFLPAFLR